MADDIWNLRKDDYFVNDEAQGAWDDRENARLALEAARKKASSRLNIWKKPVNWQQGTEAIPKHHG